MPVVDGTFIRGDWLAQSVPHRIDPARFADLGIIGEPSTNYGKPRKRKRRTNMDTVTKKGYQPRESQCWICGMIYVQRSSTQICCSDICRWKHRETK